MSVFLLSIARAAPRPRHPPSRARIGWRMAVNAEAVRRPSELEEGEREGGRKGGGREREREREKEKEKERESERERGEGRGTEQHV